MSQLSDLSNEPQNGLPEVSRLGASDDSERAKKPGLTPMQLTQTEQFLTGSSRDRSRFWHLWRLLQRSLLGRCGARLSTLLARPLAILVLVGIAALVCGIAVAAQGFIVLAAVAIVILVGIAWPWVGLRGLSCEVRCPVSRSEEGRPTQFELVVKNRWPWPVWGLAIEGGFDHSISNEIRQPDQSLVAMAVARIGGWSQSHVRWSFVPLQRGQYPLEPPRLVTGFPFGIWKAGKRVKVSSKLLVWPARFSLPPLMLPSGSETWSGQPNERAAGRLGQRSSVREYRHGDSMREIHWAKTALYDRFVSFEREGFLTTEVTISLDTDPELHEGHGPKSSVENVIRIAASVCETMLRQGISVSVVTQHGRYACQAGCENPAGLLDWLARLKTDDAPCSRLRRTARVRASTSSHSIHTTTDRSNAVSSDTIVLLSGLADQNRSGSVRSWMTIHPRSDIGSQLRRKWRNSPGGVRRAVV